MARRSTTPQVSLFPFLAVLICAMGALIFLLIVITRQIRSEARTQSRSTPEALVIDNERIENEASEPPSVTPEAPIAVEPVFRPRRLAVSPAPAVTTIPNRRPAVTDPLPTANRNRDLGRSLITARRKIVRPPAPIDPNIPLRAERDRVRARLASVRRSLAELDAERQRLETQRAEETETLSRSRTEFASLSKRSREQYDRGRKLLDRRDELADELIRLRNEVADAEAMPPVENRFRIMAHDGSTGTTRRPIAIECTEAGLVLTAEGITLTPNDLAGFGSGPNPLRSALSALVEFYADQNPDEPRPYPLLVVRPGGTIAFYAARKFLNGFPEPFGYELVTDQITLDVPTAPPAAIERARAAIANLHRIRADALAGYQFGGPGRGVGGESEGEGTGDRIPTLTASGSRFPSETSASPAAIDRFAPQPRSTGIGEPKGETAKPQAPRFRRGPHGMMILETGDDRLPGEPNELPDPWDLDRLTNSDDGSKPNTGRVTAPRRTDLPSPNERTPRFDPSQLPAPTRPGERSSATSRLGSPTTRTANQSANDPPADQRQPANSYSLPNSDPLPQQGRRKLWGQSPNRSGIGIEQTVPITVAVGKLQIGRGQPLPLPETDTDRLLSRFATELDREADTWGRPPKGFHWLPRLRFRIDAAYRARAQLWANQLETLYGIESKIELLPSMDQSR